MYIRSAPLRTVAGAEAAVSTDAVAEAVAPLVQPDTQLLAHLNAAIEFWKNVAPDMTVEVATRKNGQKPDQFDQQKQLLIYERMQPIMVLLNDQQKALEKLNNEYENIKLLWNRFLRLRLEVVDSHHETAVKNTDSKVSLFKQFFKAGDRTEETVEDLWGPAPRVIRKHH